MTLKNTVTKPTTLHNDLKIIKELVYDNCDFKLTNLQLNSESIEYGACSFNLNGQTIEHRVSKITPKKTGQFVAIWKRNKAGITEPFDITDDIDFLIITARSGDNLGQFIFPKLILEENGIITTHGKNGKRGMRIYPPWDIATNKQAVKTQNWQLNYFLTISNNNSTDLNFIKKLFSKTHKNTNHK